MKHFMMDLETLGLSANAPILQMGGCYFNPLTGEVGKSIEINLDLDSVLREGFTVEADTLLWWIRQSETAKASVFSESGLDVCTAVSQFTTFMEDAEHVWSHPTLDAMLLCEYQTRLHIEPSVAHKAYKDLRTLVYLAGINTSKYPSVGEAHTALSDCLYQIQYVTDAFAILKNRN